MAWTLLYTTKHALLRTSALDLRRVKVAFPGGNLDNVLMKVTASTMMMQSLIAQLKENGVLSEQDIVTMRARAISYSTFLKEHSGSGAQVAGVRIEEDLVALFEMLKRS
jgi:hypothetical protein